MEDKFSNMSVEEILEEALRRERVLTDFYRSVLDETGYDAQQFLGMLARAHEEHQILLKQFEEEVQLRRDMTIGMVD